MIIGAIVYRLVLKLFIDFDRIIIFFFFLSVITNLLRYAADRDGNKIYCRPCREIQGGEGGA